MKFYNINNVDSFFKVLDKCKGRVELISPEGDRINLKSKLSQYLSLVKIFHDGYIKELELKVYNDEDKMLMMNYMYQCNTNGE